MNPILQTMLAVAVLAVIAMLPLALALRRGITIRGRRESALDLHRAQLAELDRELADGRIAPTEHATARLEVQRRLLAAAEAADPLSGPTASSAPVTSGPATSGPVMSGPAASGRVRGDRALVIASLVIVPLVAVGLYLIGGHPEMPDEPHAALVAQATAEAHRDDALIESLRARVKQLDQKTEQARQGYVLLGNFEDNRGHLVAAADAWQHALDIRFDPLLAAQVAEATTQAEGRVSDRAADLYRRALDAAPKDAPWRGLVEKRLAEAKKQAG